MTAEITELWFTNLIEDCLDIKVETETTSRWSLIEGRHMVGKRILEEYGNFERANIYGEKIVQCIATSTRYAPRTLRYAIKLARLYPELSMLPAGKNISWTYIVNKYLTAGEEKPVKISPIEMIKQIKELLQTEWLKANQEMSLMSPTNYGYAKTKQLIDFIRYLQDQVEKITGE